MAVIAAGVYALAFAINPPRVDNTTPMAEGLETGTGDSAMTISSVNSSVLEVPALGNAKNEYYIFTQELDANESKVGVPVAVYSVNTIIVHNGDNVTIHFINPAEEADDRHTFTMQAPYKMDIDLAGGENQTFSFVANTTGGFTYYCRYDLPSMIGHLEVLP